jgi:hypothetical protein
MTHESVVPYEKNCHSCSYCDGFAQTIKPWSQKKKPLRGKHLPNAGNNRRIVISITIEENDLC